MWTPAQEPHDAEVLGGTPTVSTYHSYAGRLVREHALRLGVEPESRLLSEAAAWQFAAEVVERHDGPMDEVPFAASTITHAVVDLAGEMAEHLLVPADLHRLIDRFEARAVGLPKGASRARALPRVVAEAVSALKARRQVLPLVEAYQELKRSRDALDFADQMALAASLAQRFPDIGSMERQRFRAVLLDEFQDTSEAQLVLLRHLRYFQEPIWFVVEFVQPYGKYASFIMVAGLLGLWARGKCHDPDSLSRRVRRRFRRGRRAATIDELAQRRRHPPGR